MMFNSRLGAFMCVILLMVNLTVLPAYAAETKSEAPANVQSGSPYIGGCRLRDVTPMQIQSIMAGFSGKSNSLRFKVLVSLRSIFNAAHENGLIARSLVSSVLKPTGNTAQEKESWILLEKVQNTRARTFLLTALHTGCHRYDVEGVYIL